MASDKTTKVYIIYYSMYGHVAQLAKKQKEGVDSVPGCEGVLLQVTETLPPEITEKMHAPPQDESIPFVTPDKLTEPDGILFGFPTRFGNVAGQFKSFWDATGQLWAQGALQGKPFGAFSSTATQGGGQELTIYTSLTNFIGHGMIYVPLGTVPYSEVTNPDELNGGNPWGATTYAGKTGARQPTEVELAIAKRQGAYSAEVFKKLAGKA